MRPKPSPSGRLAEDGHKARGSLEHDLPLKEASGEPAGRSLTLSSTQAPHSRGYPTLTLSLTLTLTLTRHHIPVNTAATNPGPLAWMCNYDPETAMAAWPFSPMPPSVSRATSQGHSG